MLLAATIFFVSIVGIVGIFALKSWERRTQRILVPLLRKKMDIHAMQAKELLGAASIDLAKLPPAGLRLARFLAHEAVLGLAFLARVTEGRLHRLADLVSHKHRFEKRETRSEFLKKVSEHKNGNGSNEEVTKT